jgi:uncharacterized protein (TIGR02246 family)
MRTIPLLLCTLLVAGCYPQAGTNEADVAAITAVFAEFDAALAAGDQDRVLALYADDVVAMPPDMPPRVGIDAQRESMEGYFDQFTFELTSQVEEVQVAGDIAFAVVSWSDTVTPKAEGEVEHEQGKWLVILKKQADGSWKTWREMWSSYEPSGM